MEGGRVRPSVCAPAGPRRVALWDRLQLWQAAEAMRAELNHAELSRKEYTQLWLGTAGAG